jgi:peptidoglycan/xylan/chitin deacetylase (PgdA/CDA1 family)
MPVIRILNYHAVPERLADSFARHLQHLAKRFRLARADELERVLAEGPGRQSALFVSFDDGLENHWAHGARLLEEFGATGFFSVPAAFPDAPADWFTQHVYPEPTELHLTEAETRPMRWEQIADLGARGHRICAHGFDHVVLDGETDDATLGREIVDSRARIQERVPGLAVDGFCWPGRSPRTPTAAGALVQQRYSFSLGTQARRFRGGRQHDLPRVNVEASWPLELVDFQLSGILDGVYAARSWRAR